jgi:4-amino-4-deoxy-L-arabinose transferase-like glycosyltransferase
MTLARDEHGLMRSSLSLAAAAAPLGRLLDALSDPKRRDRAVLVVLAAYCAAWTLYAVLSKASQDIHFDMGEMVAWSRDVGFGTPKHPPLPAWLVGAWFAVFPLAEWAYYLLAMVVATAAMWVAWAASAPYLAPDKRAIGLALLMLVPFFNFHALKYNANSAMMPWWALTTWLFLRSFETRGLGAAAFAGVAAVAAMLTKYWSIVLIAALAIAALCDPRRRTYFASAAPYVTIVVGAAALAPHVVWLFTHDFVPFRYALETHPASLAEALISGVGYVAGALGYVALPILLVALAARPGFAAVAEALWPDTPQRRLVAIAFVLPLLLPTILAVATAEKAVSLWSIASMTLLPVVLLSSPQVVIPRRAAIAILGIAVASPVVAIAAAPVVAMVTHLLGAPNYAAHYRLVAQAAEKVWREATPDKLRLVGSYNNLLYGTVFYFADRPSAYEIVSPDVTPWADDARITRDGILIYCPVAEMLCMDALAARTTGLRETRRIEVEISRSFLGLSGAPVRYAIVAIPPAASRPISP